MTQNGGKEDSESPKPADGPDDGDSEHCEENGQEIEFGLVLTGKRNAQRWDYLEYAAKYKAHRNKREPSD